MSVVSVTNVVVGRNPSRITDPFELEITLECLEALAEDLEWRLVYVGNADDKSQDQELDCVSLGPIQRGALRFVFAADPPDFTKIDKDDIHGITIILLTGSYKSQEFVRVGFYVHNYFADPAVAEFVDTTDVPLPEILDKLNRVIIADAPRITRFNIDWDNPACDPLLLTELPPASSSSLGVMTTDSYQGESMRNDFHRSNGGSQNSCLSSVDPNTLSSLDGGDGVPSSVGDIEVEMQNCVAEDAMTQESDCDLGKVNHFVDGSRSHEKQLLGGPQPSYGGGLLPVAQSAFMSTKNQSNSLMTGLPPTYDGSNSRHCPQTTLAEIVTTASSVCSQSSGSFGTASTTAPWDSSWGLRQQPIPSASGVCDEEMM